MGTINKIFAAGVAVKLVSDDLSVTVIVLIISYSLSVLYQIKTHLNIPFIPCGLSRVNSVSDTHWRESLT